MKTKFVVPAFPSASVTSLIDAVTPLSSLVIVPVPRLSALIEIGPVELTRSTKNVSFGSGTVSPVTGIVIWKPVAFCAIGVVVFDCPV